MFDGSQTSVNNGKGNARVLRIAARLNVGGVARHVAWLTAGLKDRCQSILVTGTVPPGEDDMSSFARELGVEPVVITQMSREISLGDIISIWKLYRLMCRIRPHIVHTHTAKAGTVGRVAGFLYRWLTPSILWGQPRKCRFIHTYHGHIFHSYYGKWKTRFFLWIEKILAWLITDRIVVISRQQFHEIHKKFGVGKENQFNIIPLGLDLSAFAHPTGKRHLLRDELGFTDQDLLVGIVGRLTEIKNHQLFLQVASLYKEKYGTGGARRVRFLIIGNGHLRSELENQAQVLGLRDDVCFLGMRNDPDAFYAALDVVALTSHNEGTPLTLIEGMANARPAISTNVGGVVDLLGPPLATALGTDAGFTICERGILVRPGDAVGFCHGLAHLLAHGDLRRELGQRGEWFIQRNYSKDRLLADIANLYNGLTTARHTQPTRVREAALS